MDANNAATIIAKWYRIQRARIDAAIEVLYEEYLQMERDAAQALAPVQLLGPDWVPPEELHPEGVMAPDNPVEEDLEEEPYEEDDRYPGGYGSFYPEEERFIPCCRCGHDCSGGDYESWRICSRSCLVRDNDYDDCEQRWRRSRRFR